MKNTSFSTFLHFKKLTLFMLLTFCMVFQMYAAGSLKDKTVKFLSKSVTVKEMIQEIENQTDYLCVYSNGELNTLAKINLKSNSVSLENLLQHFSKEMHLNYDVTNKYIVISKTKEEAKQLLAAQNNVQQKRTISGVVTSKSGETIIGANVVQEGTTNGTITDFDGKFTLTVPQNAKLVVTYIGYKTTKVKVSSAVNGVLKIVLDEDSKVLDEVVVVGYGEQKKVNLTGSVATVSTDKLEGRAQNDLLSSIQGAVPGVTVITRPNGGTEINFRGRGNLGASSPLYVIDGVISNSTFFSQLDPTEIENISFLKDAASASIYGSRAAYGVVLVTTKKGAKEKTNVSYNGYVGVNTPANIPENVSSWEYAEMLNEGIWNRDFSKGKFQAYSQEEIDTFKDGSNPDYYPNTDFFGEVLEKSSLTTRHSVDVSGGGAKSTYYIGLGYLYNDNPSYIDGQNNDRYNFNGSISSEIYEWLNVNANVKYILGSSNTDNGIPSLRQIGYLPATFVGRHTDGTWGSMSGGQQAPQTFLQDNPFKVMDKANWSETTTSNAMFDFGVTLKPIKDLSIKASASYLAYEYKSKSYTALQDDVINFETKNPIDGTGVYTNKMGVDWRQTTRWLYSAVANYSKDFDVHHLSVLGGTTYEDNKYQRVYISRKNFPIDGLKDINAGSNAKVDMDNQGGSYENKMLSFFGRVNYSYAEKYLFEANVRADASSRFHKDNRWGIFPSFSFGWRINEENFLKDVDWLSNLKLRASWGELGNINNVGNYDYAQNYSANANYSFDDKEVKGIQETRPANSGLGWETVKMTNVGFDMDVFNGKLSFTADYYIKNTHDILLAYSVARETGIGNPPSQNIGKVRNSGIEMALSHRNSIGELNYSVGVNYAYNKNEIKELGDSNNSIYKIGDLIRGIYRVGEPIGSYYGYKSNRNLYSNKEIEEGHYYSAFGRKPNAGDLKYIPNRPDLEYGSSITGDDRYILGCSEPTSTFGFNVNMDYKGFDFSLLAQGAAGAKIANQMAGMPFQYSQSPRVMHRDRWTAENPVTHARFPRLYGGHSLDNYNWSEFSDLFVYNGNYLRLKNITIGYTLPKYTIPCVSRLRLYFTTENLLTIKSKNLPDEIDPEESAGWGSYGYGKRSYVFGVNLTF